MGSFLRSGTLVDIVAREIYPATVHIVNGQIARIERDEVPKSSDFLLPGFIDSHIQH